MPELYSDGDTFIVIGHDSVVGYMAKSRTRIIGDLPSADNHCEAIEFDSATMELRISRSDVVCRATMRPLYDTSYPARYLTLFCSAHEQFVDFIDAFLERVEIERIDANTAIP